MKKIFFIRHAKASWDHPEESDFDRELTEQGEKDAHLMSQQLKEQKIKPDFVISSSAPRAIKTAEIIVQELGFAPQKIVKDMRIYTAGVEELTEIVEAIDAKYNTVIFVGHNPGLTSLAHFLCEGLKMNISTCGILGIAFDIKNWHDVVEAEGKFLSYSHPHYEHLESHKHPYEEG